MRPRLDVHLKYAWNNRAGVIFFLTLQVTAVVMHLGEIKFKQKSSKDDQAQPTDKASGDKVAKLLGLETSLLFENFVKPKIKVNTTHYNRISGGKLSSLFC